MKPLLIALVALGVSWHEEPASEPSALTFAVASLPLRFEPGEPATQPDPTPDPVNDSSYADVYADAVRDGTGLMVASRMETSLPYWRERAATEGRIFCVDDSGRFAQGVHRLDSKFGRAWRRISHLYAGPNYWKIRKFTGPDGADIWTGRTKSPAQEATYGNVVVVSPASFGCPACESLKSQLRSAGVAFHERNDDSAGPWPRLYMDGSEIRPATMSALSATAGAPVLSNTGYSESVRSAYSANAMGSGYSVRMRSNYRESVGRRRGPVRAVLRSVFRPRRNRARMRYRSSMSMNVGCASCGG